LKSLGGAFKSSLEKLAKNKGVLSTLMDGRRKAQGFPAIFRRLPHPFSAPSHTFWILPFLWTTVGASLLIFSFEINALFQRVYRSIMDAFVKMIYETLLSQKI